MTKVINKKALWVLLTLVMAFYWLTVPVSAAEIDDEICAANEVSPRWGGTVSYLKFETIDIYAFAGYNLKGQAVGTDVNNTHATWTGPGKGFFCYLPEEFYQGMIDQNYDQFLCFMTFEIDGMQLTRYEVLVDGEIVKSETKNVKGIHEVTWISPRKPSTEIGIKVYAEYDSSIPKSTIWGRAFLQ